VSAHLIRLRWCGYVRAEVDGRFNRYALVDDRIREILATGESRESTRGSTSLSTAVPAALRTNA